MKEDNKNLIWILLILLLAGLIWTFMIWAAFKGFSVQNSQELIDDNAKDDVLYLYDQNTLISPINSPNFKGEVLGIMLSML